ncbi:uncharacterized protein TrAFT101_011743 [Trichoderma asperellum]|uniref:uncharacterized protein n=1 Tax=Trichoderma asperellum TaxID=101201 RepID=UPI0033242353|nr:hypothetical protein TrAFT101_011743 [Trichoderma asperellum]
MDSILAELSVCVSAPGLLRFPAHGTGRGPDGSWRREKQRPTGWHCDLGLTPQSMVAEPGMS